MDQDIVKNKIAIISVLYNSDELLEDFFLSISLQIGVPFTLFLLDNNANEKTVGLVDELGIKYDLTDAIVYVPAPENLGFAKGNNFMIEKALALGYDYFLLSNNDISFDSKTLLADLKVKCEKYKIVTPKILYAGTDKIWYCGGHINKNKGINIHEFEFSADSLVPQVEKAVGFAPACFLLIKREVFEKIGLFDTKYFVYWEDVDFCIRAMNQGYHIYLIPNLTIDHKVSITTGGRASLFSTYYFLRNRLYFIRKHFNKPDKFRSLVYTYMTSFVKVLIYDFPRKRMIMKAIFDSKRM